MAILYMIIEKIVIEDAGRRRRSVWRMWGRYF